MNYQELKKLFSPWFEEMGFVAKKPSKNLFIQDRGFYIIMASFQPLYGDGFFLSVAVKFLWTDIEPLTFDFFVDDCRIYGKTPPHPTGATFFDSPTIYEEIEYMKKQIKKRVQIYQKLSKPAYLAKMLSKRNDTAVVADRGYKKRDTDLAIAKVLLGKSKEASKLFSNSLEYHNNPVIKELNDLCFDKKAFTSRIIEIINDMRRTQSKNLKISLEDITSL